MRLWRLWKRIWATCDIYLNSDFFRIVREKNLFLRILKKQSQNLKFSHAPNSNKSLTRGPNPLL